MIQCAVHLTGRRALVRYQQAEVDVRIVTRDEYGSALHLATGSAPACRGDSFETPRDPRLGREEEVYAHAGLAWIAPELRQATGEVEAAAVGIAAAPGGRDRYPRRPSHAHDLQRRPDSLRRWSMRGGARLRIHRDHRPLGSCRRVAHGDGRCARPSARRHRQAPATGPGDDDPARIEVDIMPDGRLDFDDEVLESLDIVLASLHDRAGHDPTG